MTGLVYLEYDGMQGPCGLEPTYLLMDMESWTLLLKYSQREEEEGGGWGDRNGCVQRLHGTSRLRLSKRALQEQMAFSRGSETFYFCKSSHCNHIPYSICRNKISVSYVCASASIQARSQRRNEPKSRHTDADQVLIGVTRMLFAKVSEKAITSRKPFRRRLAIHKFAEILVAHAISTTVG